MIFRKGLVKDFFDNVYALKKCKKKFFQSFILFDIPPKISFYAKTNYPFFESFTLTKIRIELICYLTNLAKSGPENKMFCKF